MSAVHPLLERTVTVCSECHRASCWHGLFMCDNNKSAGTVDLMVADLEALHLEHPCYWFTDPADGKIDRAALVAYSALGKESKP